MKLVFFWIALGVYPLDNGGNTIEAFDSQAMISIQPITDVTFVNENIKTAKKNLEEKILKLWN